MLHQAIEKEIENGWLLIVPWLGEEVEKQPDNTSYPTVTQIKAWEQSKVKEYKIKILLHKDNKLVDRNIGSKKDPTIRELDGRKLIFLNDFRPRARYLYYLYCVQILKQAWTQSSPTPGVKMPPKGEILKDTIGKGFWGTRGSYMAENMLRGFVDELGHEFEFLMEGAMESAANESDPIGLLAGAVDIEAAAPTSIDEEDDDDEDDE
jgi:hypothetical protein